MKSGQLARSQFGALRVLTRPARRPVGR